MESAEASNSRPWADEPFQLIPLSILECKPGEKVKPSYHMAYEMLLAHNLFLRGINSIYLQCINIEKSPTDILAFVNYASCWSRILHHHHAAEETFLFPEIEKLTGKPGLMDINVNQHHGFQQGLENYEKYLESVKSTRAQYQGAKLKEIIDSFMPILQEHLVEEIVTLKVLEEYEDKVDLAKWTSDVSSKITKDAQTPDGMAIDFPFALMNHDATYNPGRKWPPVPWLVLLVMKFLYFGKHLDWWQFAPCDKNGKPRDLPFAV